MSNSTSDNRNTHILVFVDLEDEIKTKAEYALSVLLSKCGLIPIFDNLAHLQKKGGIYYGNNPTKISFDQPKRLLMITPNERSLKVYQNISFSDFDDFYASLNLAKSALVESESTVVLQSDIVAATYFYLAEVQALDSDVPKDAHQRLAYENSIDAFNHFNTAILHTMADALADNLNRLGFVFDSYDWDIPNKSILALSFDIDCLGVSFPGRVYRMMHKYKRDKELDPSVLWLDEDIYFRSVYSTLDELKERGLKATFFIKTTAQKTKFDARNYMNDKRTLILIERIEKDGHEIGLHTSYNAAFNQSLMSKEKLRLEQVIGKKVTAHRSHYLRYDPVKTASYLNELGFKTDSTLGWSGAPSVRAQMASPYLLFDILNNKKTDVLEIPLAAMDVQFFGYQKWNLEKSVSVIKQQCNFLRSLGAVVSWDFHHNIYDRLLYPEYERFFNECLDAAYDMSFCTFSEIRNKWISHVQ